MLSIPYVAEVNTSDQQDSISFDFMKQELDENIKDETILDECVSEKFQDFSEGRKNIGDQFTNKNLKIRTKEELLTVCKNYELLKHKEFTSIDDQLPNEAKPLVVHKKYFIQALMPKEESESIDIEENKIIVNHFINNDICHNDIGKCINENLVKHEENESSHGQLSNGAELLVDDRENFVDALRPKDESESLGIEENKIMVKNCINNEGLICNNDISEWNTYTFESKKTEEFAAENKSTYSFSNLEADNCLEEQIVDRVFDLKQEKHKCLICNYSTLLKINLQSHIESIHLKLRNHKCHVCDYSSVRKSHLKEHIDFVHSKLKNHFCHLCDYSASRKSCLQVHIDSVHLKLKNLKCHICGYSASQKSCLEQHVVTVHLKLKNHKCYLCDYSASRKSQLKLHMNFVHLKLKNHKCHICDYSASRKTHLQEHIDVVHSKLKNNKCHLCDYSASRKSYLQVHIDSVHLKLKNHKCQVCEYSASQKRNLLRHIDSVHLKLKNRECHL